MRKVINYINIFLGLLLICLLSGCEHEVFISGPPGEEGVASDKVRLEIFTRTGPDKLPLLTRGLADEDKVGRTPWVFVFKGTGDDATFVEAVQAFEFGGKRYVLLTNQAEGPGYQLLILANPLDEFYYANTKYDFDENGLSAVLIPGTTKVSDVCTNMLTPPLASPSNTVIPYSAAGETIPMSYLLKVNKIDNTTKIGESDGSPLLLTRVVAKMVVTNTAANFTLEGITSVVNVPRQGRLHSLNGTIMDNSSNLTEYLHDGTYSSSLVEALSVAGGQSTADNPIYLYEFEMRDDRYIIIQGRYEEKDYYYKMAIVDNNEQLINILRNHYYQFTITKVKGPGYNTVEDAKASKPSNTALDYKILVDDSYSYEIMANNDYYLGVSNSVFITYTDVSDNYEVFKFTTNCKTIFPSSNISDNRREQIDEGEAFQLIDPSSGTKIPIMNAMLPDPNITAVTVKVTDWLKWYEDCVVDDYGVRRINAYVILKLGNLEKKVWIRQRAAIPSSGTTLQYAPSVLDKADGYNIKYYCLSAYVEDGADWLKLHPSSDADRETTDNIVVDDGIILIKVLPNISTQSRTGILYLTTIKDPTGPADSSSTQRIKISITQKGQESINVR